MTLTVTGIRTGAESGTGSAGAVGTALQGLYGTLTIQADGSYLYVPNDGDPAVDGLAQGETLKEYFSYG